MTDIEAQDGQPTEGVEKLPPALTSFGTTGLQRTGGFIGDEFLSELRGIRGVRAFKEMADNDPIAGGMVFGIQQILARLPWEIQGPENPSPEEAAATEFITSCFDDMDTPWTNVLEDAMSMATYGWSFLEMNLKIRRGPDEPRAEFRSKFTDNRLGWRGFEIRSHETLSSWEYDEHGHLLGMSMMDPNGIATRPIPLAKALLFRTTSFKDNPEGRSLLRGAYRPWFFKKRIEEFEGIGIERDLAGLPVATLPAEYFSPDASAAHKATLQTMTNLVTGIRNDASGGVVMPVAYDGSGNKLIDFVLMNAGGTKAIDTNAVIKRKSEEMAMSILMDFLMLGHTNTGSFALGTAKIDLWTMAVDSLAKSIAATFSKYAIDTLLKWNKIKVDRQPELVYGEVSNIDLPSLGTFIKSMVDAGILTPGPELDRWTREVAKLPPSEALPDDDPYGHAGVHATDAKLTPDDIDIPIAPPTDTPPALVAPAVTPDDAPRLP